MDCQSLVCDFDHFRREILFVDWVRDRQDADIHLLITSQQTGAGGLEITVQLIGRNQFDGIEDRLAYVSDRTDTEQETRAGLTQTLKLGLARFLVGTERADWVQLLYMPPAGQTVQTTEEDDPWNFWVFQVSLSGAVGVQQSTSSLSLRGDLAADRTTEAWKFNLQLSTRYQENKFDLSDAITLTSISRDYSSNVLLVKSLGDHFSAGVQGRVASSTFSNFDLAVRAAPALELNVFPYYESTRRQFRFLYSVGFNHFDYAEETIFSRTEETKLDQSLSVSVSLTEPWGSAQVVLVGSHFLDDFDQNRLTLFSLGNVRVFRGLSLSLFGSISHVADQLSLPRGGATDEEILLRRKELETSFLFDASIGFSYTFGSTYSNVVNPRFGGKEGGVTRLAHHSQMADQLSGSTAVGQS